MSALKWTALLTWLLLTAACGRGSSASHDAVIGPGQPIDRPGIYTLKGCNTVLKVDVRDHIVHFVLLDANGRTLFTSGHPEISSTHRWSMNVDDSCAVFVNSSDIGHYRLRKEPYSGQYYFVSVSYFSGQLP